jgi:uncharacterized protein (TIGR04255 family)
MGFTHVEMTITFKDPPLAEIVAELRWRPAEMLNAAAGFPMPVFANVAAPYEEAFMRFITKVAPEGFETFERLIPPGGFLIPHQPAVRIKPKIGTPGSTIYQLGPNVFTANALPPYESWDKFNPVVRRGVIALFETRSQAEKDLEVVVILRYINAFGETLTGGLPAAEFLSTVMGIETKLPDAITRHRAQGKLIEPAFKLSVPLTFGTMDITIGKGVVQQAAALVMDTAITFERPIAPDVDVVMTAFSKARDVIHDSFVRLTKPIHSKMHPV